MRLPRRRFLQLAAGAVALSAVSRIASAQAYPSRPITIIVPYAAGAPSDVVARIFVERMRESLGQPVIIENITGANGTLGIGRVVRAKPDGYTLAFSVSSATHVYNSAIHSLPYDVVSDFEPVALVTRENGQLILAKKTLPANNLKELIFWLKENPSKAVQGNSGPGSPAHVSGIFFQKLTGTRFQFATYRNVGQAMQDLIAGHIDLMFFPPVALAAVQAGTIKAYAITAKNRLAAAPEIPTVDEAGLPGFYISNWFALWAPKGTPREVVARLNAAVVESVAEPTVRQRLGGSGLEVAPREEQTPEALAALLKAEIEKWWPIIREAGIKLD